MGSRGSHRVPPPSSALSSTTTVSATSATIAASVAPTAASAPAGARSRQDMWHHQHRVARRSGRRELRHRVHRRWRLLRGSTVGCEHGRLRTGTCAGFRAGMRKHGWRYCLRQPAIHLWDLLLQHWVELGMRKLGPHHPALLPVQRHIAVAIAPPSLATAALLPRGRGRQLDMHESRRRIRHDLGGV